MVSILRVPGLIGESWNPGDYIKSRHLRWIVVVVILREKSSNRYPDGAHSLPREIYSSLNVPLSLLEAT